MSRLPVRFSLLILCIGAMAGAGYLLWSSARSTDRSAASLRSFDTIARQTRAAIGDLRAAQQSYVAAGQGEDFWFGRVSEISKQIDDSTAALRAGAATPQAVIDLESAATTVQEFLQMDQRAREYIRAQQPGRASDMIFGDGFELTRKAGEAIDRALTAEQVARDASQADVRRTQVAALGGAAGLTFLGLVLLVPVKRSTPPEPATTRLVTPAPPPAAPPLSDLSEFGYVAKPAPRPPAQARPSIDLGRIAVLCSDLARVTDTRALPAILERTAAILDAAGVVLWIADPDGRELAPILVHGYPPQLATRLGTIGRDDGNVTALAFRTKLLQTMKADAVSNGAIAVPLVAATGCVGVMAAEMNNSGEQRDALLAAAGIIAAQLATLVGPPAARGTKTEAAS